MPRKEIGRHLDYLALGILGSILAAYLGRTIGWYQEGQSADFVTSVLEAILPLTIYRLVREKKSA